MSNEFEAYQKFIIQHENYKTLPNKVSDSGDITWVKVKDLARTKWWDALKVTLGLPDRASVARSIHPKELAGYKPCQVCGRKMSIHYVYPDVNTLRKLNVEFLPLSFDHFNEEIDEIARNVFEAFGEVGLLKLAKCFGISKSYSCAKELVSEIKLVKRGLSPGAMSNAPDRLDGFHTYNACCRSKEDTGRHRSNLVRYGVDRRAYENWADGNWRGADRLMGLYRQTTQKVACPNCSSIKEMSPDHIGPISLGFMHRMQFQALCISCNSSKNNRLTFKDVQTLMEIENSGEQVASWHTLPIWEMLKPIIVDDSSAVEASFLMRRNLHHVLILLSEIDENGYSEFLMRYLHPEYAKYDYDFEDFNVLEGTYKAKRRRVDSANTRSQSERYVRISFDSLNDYASKENRKNSKWESAECDTLLSEIIGLLSSNRENEAHIKILELFGVLAQLAILDFQSNS
jgi:Alw26I/Eco31I/Esp3I family type II restriction endonuclease